MYQPLVENDTPEHREMNRRIEIVLVPLTPQELHKRAKTPGILGNPAAPHTAPAGDRGSSSAERNL
jgi:hypothetical protein